ncbi:MAG: site-2 protease family protein [Clostridiales bacterium]|nr:site-2 protease family protein [Clostridiales bacterium]
MFSFIGVYEGVEFIKVSIAFLCAIIIALSLHEFAHAYVAYKCGDNTPKMQGRVSINPLKHIDPVGFVCCALFGFGWARPVQVNPNNFRNIKKGQGWTSVAGVLMNLFLGFIGCGLYTALSNFAVNNALFDVLLYFLYFTFFINICLAVFNILPIYPLDGFKLVENYTKYGNGYVNFMYRYGNLILLAVVLLFSELLSMLISFIVLPISLFWGLIF